MHLLVLLTTVLGCDRDGALEASADVTSSGSPARDLGIYVNGFHYASGDPSVQMEVDHYCNQRKDGLIQCVLYDNTGEYPNLIGVEHIVPREVFERFPDAEKALWHPHTYEVKSGVLVAPSLPLAAEHDLMEAVVTTYGKTWHVWDPLVDDWPIGVPTLMKGFTADGQLDPELLASRDDRLGIDTAEHKANRADIADPGFDRIVLEEPRVCTAPAPPPIPID